MISADLIATGSVAPVQLLDNATLLERGELTRDPGELAERTGIQARRWVAEDDDAAGPAAQAVRNALASAGMEAHQLRRLIFVNSTGGDFLIPATANAVLEHLGVAGTCDGFDVNNACMGFLTSLDLAARSVATGLSPVCVVAAETLSRYLAPSNPRPYFVLADAVAAAILSDAGQGGAFLASVLGNDGRHRGAVAMDHPGRTGKGELIRFADSNREITRVAVGALMESAQRALEAAGLELKDIDWFVPHQPNGSMLKKLVQLLGIDPDKVVPVVHKIGSVGAASIAMGLHVLWSSRPVQPGQTILLFGVGAGMSYGAMIYRVGGRS